MLILVPWLWSCSGGPVPVAGVEAADRPVFSVTTLAPGGTVDGIHRQVRDVGGLLAESPALAVSADGGLWMAWVELLAEGQRLVLQGPEGEPRSLAEGDAIWRPVLASGEDGSVWMAWEQGQDPRRVLVQRVDQPSEVLELCSGSWCGWPDLAVGSDGGVHAVWEEELDRERTRIAYERLGSQTQTVAEGWLLRRPSLALDGASVVVAWDQLQTGRPVSGLHRGGPLDPDVDVYVARWEGSWGLPRLMAGGAGVQSSPELVLGAEGVLVAYHDSREHGLVKWWVLRAMDGREIRDPMEQALPVGEQQGAEFPAVAVLPGGGVALVTRSSQGAYLHIADEQGVHTPYDLTRSGWGARGVRAAVAVGADGTLHALRRARKSLVLESFTGLGERDRPGLRPSGEFGKQRRSEPAQRPLRALGGTVAWGDVHMHSALSDGTGTPDEVLARAWARGLDFAVLSDHDNIVGSRMFPGEHAELLWVTDKLDRLDGFTTLHAYEWTTPPTPAGSGHQIAYFKGRPPAVYGYRDVAPTLPELNRKLNDLDVFTAPHHTTWTGTPWQDYEQDVQRQFEIVSVHGLAESPGQQHIAARGSVPDSSASSGLALGLQYGFMGGSDAHGLLWHHGIGRRRDPWTQGLTGVICREPCDRGALFDSLYARHSFATSGPPMVALIWSGQARMGDSGSAGDSVRLQWRARGTRELQQAVIVRDGVEIEVLELGGLEAEGSFTDSPGPGSHSYYLRVLQAPDDESVPDLAWSSPLFLEVSR
jgi:hypothetical protein